MYLRRQDGGVPVWRSRRFWRSLPFLALFVNPACSSTQDETIRTLPVQVYRYSFEAAPEMDSGLSDLQIRELFDAVNEVWAEFGIQWQIKGIEDRTISKAAFPSAPTERLEVRQQLQAVSPTTVSDEVWNVVLIREFPVPAGGIYLPPEQTVYFAQWARGGPTSPVILAHELGHSLGLKHEMSSSNLMNQKAGGRDIPEEYATSLSTSQVSTARAQASRGPSQSTQPGAPVGGQTRSGSQGQDPASRKARAADRLRSFDEDGDGIILIDDVPPPGQRVFRRIDQNGDGRLNEEELSDFEGGR